MTHGRAFRFLHASDLQLDVPLAGPVGLSASLRKRLAEAPYRSAEAVFTAAIEEQVDFVLLAGGALNLDQAAPSEVHFLVQQFQRLAARKIPVYWAGSATDSPASWTPQHRLPENVVHLAVGAAADAGQAIDSAAYPAVGAGGRGKARVRTLLIERDGVAVARLAGLSRQPQQRLNQLDWSLPRHPAPLFTIGLLHLRRDEDFHSLAEVPGVDYWALGGRLVAEENVRHEGQTPARFCGSPVGRTLEHLGAHGCSLVSVDEQGVHRRAIATASVVWRLESVEVNLGDTLEAIELRVRNRCQQILAARDSGADCIVSWRLVGPHAVLHRARLQAWDTQLTERLQQTYGQQTPAIWSRAVELQPFISTSAESYPADSLCGTYLRSAAQYRPGEREQIDLQPYRNESVPALPAEVAQVDGPGEVSRLLNEAALLGAEFLQDKEAY